MNEFQGKIVSNIISNEYDFEIYFTDGSAIRVQTGAIFDSGLKYETKERRITEER